MAVETLEHTSIEALDWCPSADAFEPISDTRVVAPRPGVMRRALCFAKRHPIFELLAFAVLAVAYNVVRSIGGVDKITAMSHASDILSAEGWVFDHLEVPLNDWFLSHTAFAVVGCYIYAVLHYVATPTVFFLSRRRGGWQYWRGYWSLAVASGFALIGYALYPAAPPRLASATGITDIMAHFSQYGWWGGAASAPRGIGDATNQYAAMPSMHFGWSLWCAIQLWGFNNRIARTVAVAYPTILGLVVLGTGNHFLLDVVAGAGCVVLAYGVVTLIRRVARSRANRWEALAGAAV
jgi:PAP2 superfamily